MFSKLSSLARSSVIALAALSSLPAAAPAAPLGPIGQPAIADNGAIKPIPVEMGNGRDCGPGYCGFRRGWGGRHWDRGWNGRHWNGRYAGDWRRGGWRHGGWRRGGWGPGLAFGLGLGLPLGYYGGGAPLGYYGGGYDDYYPGYYDRPVYRPRVYRRHPNNYYYRSYRRGTYNGETGPHCDNAYLNGPNFYRCEGR